MAQLSSHPDDIDARDRERDDQAERDYRRELAEDRIADYADDPVLLGAQDFLRKLKAEAGQ